MVKEIREEECLSLKPLWERVFSEDSQEFTDYYFEEKVKRNHAFVIEKDKEKTGEMMAASIPYEDVAAMLHLSPYNMRLRVGDRFICQEANYIVGVATQEQYRRRGYMRMLLEASLSDLYGQGQPFAFLMPASPKIYEPYQFVYIYDKKKYETNISMQNVKAAGEIFELSSGRWEVALLKEDELSELLPYVNRYLEEHYDVFMDRDEAYYETLIKELKVQQGGIFLVRKENDGEAPRKIEGYFLHTKEEEKEDIQEAIFENTSLIGKAGILQEKNDQPIIMARIVDAAAMLSLLRLKEPKAKSERQSKEVVLTIQIEDPIIMGNNGLWRCHISEEEAFIQKCEDDDMKVMCIVGIDALTSWVFGYREAEGCFSFSEEKEKEKVLTEIERIRVFSHIFINEIV